MVTFFKMFKLSPIKHMKSANWGVFGPSILILLAFTKNVENTFYIKKNIKSEKNIFTNLVIWTVDSHFWL